MNLSKLKKIIFIALVPVSFYFASVSYGVMLTVQTEPDAEVVNIANIKMGTTPLQIELMSDDTIVVRKQGYYSAAIRIAEVAVSEETNWEVVPPAITTMSLPGQSPLEVVVSEKSDSVLIKLRPIQNNPIQ